MELLEGMEAYNPSILTSTLGKMDLNNVSSESTMAAPFACNASALRPDSDLEQSHDTSLIVQST